MRLILPKNFREFLFTLMLLCALSSIARGAPTAFTTDASIKAASEEIELQHYDAALKALGPALESSPNNPEVLNLHGAILTKQKNYAAALPCYQKALKESPKFFPAIYNIGALLALQERWPEAITYYRDLLIEQPNNELVEFKLLLLLIHENADPELQAKLFATDLPTATPAWYYARAARSFKKGDPGEAAKYLEVAKNIYGDQTEIFQQELDESGLNKK